MTESPPRLDAVLPRRCPRRCCASLPDDAAALTHTSPPYNIERGYRGFRDRQDVDAYRDLVRDVLEQLHRLTRPGGSVFWQVGYTTIGEGPGRESGGIQVLDALTLPIAEDAGFRLWDRIVWNYFGSMAFRTKFTNRHETILWLVKPEAEGSLAPLFQLDEIREKAKSYDGRNHLFGRNPGNVWSAERVAFGSSGQTSHVAVFPEEVSERIVRACSRAGDLVLDPFAGSGTLPKVARTLGRRFIGCEISGEYLREADERLRLWGTSEAENLAIGLIVRHAFRGRAGSRPLQAVAGALDAHVPRVVPLARVRELEASCAEILAAPRVTKAIKHRKRVLWERNDEFIVAGDESDPIIAADRALSFCYGHRSKWNGVRRVLSAGQALHALRNSIDGAGGADRYVESLCAAAHTRFNVDDGDCEVSQRRSGTRLPRGAELRVEVADADGKTVFSKTAAGGMPNGITQLLSEKLDTCGR